ncbi:MAG: hypothetical protein RL708_1801 [Bacteroidota bacterium]|jgi:UDP-N-acetylmuramoyl-tripeptide--D-alanyl-D-alanine ligase
MTIENLYKIFIQQQQNFTTDTRKIESGSIFFALKGANFNGNEFAEKALELGASYVVIDEKQLAKNEKFILVDDVLTTLQQLAIYHRQQFKIPVLCIGGSNGKTTTKELISKVLAEKYKVHTTAGNFNNHIGVPITLLKMPLDSEFAVIEIGANHLLETKVLCEIAQPNFGLITNNGKDHLEGFGDMEGVKKANAELYDFLKTINGNAFVNAGDVDLKTASVGLHQLFYSDNLQVGCFGSIENSFPFLKTKIKINGAEFQIQSQLNGNYNVINIVAAAAVGSYFGVSNEQIKNAIENYKPANNRSQLIEKNGNHFIVDCYNANPSSMKLAIESFAEMPVKSKIAIVGDMFELGNHSEFEHHQIANQLHNSSFEKVIVVGKEFAKLKTEFNHFISFETTAELKQWMNEQQFTNHTFLLKASRGMALEKLLD